MKSKVQTFISLYPQLAESESLKIEKVSLLSIFFNS